VMTWGVKMTEGWVIGVFGVLGRSPCGCLTDAVVDSRDESGNTLELERES
jgi:hypothetical protein